MRYLDIPWFLRRNPEETMEGKMFADLGTAPKQVYEQNGGFYYKEYGQHPGEEGWYVYFKPNDPRCRSIRECGPLKGDEADDLIERLTRERFGA